MKSSCGVAMCLLIVLGGCVSPFTRGQSEEESEREKDLDVRLIGDVTEVANVNAQQVSGVGLVTGLDGTGDAPQGQFRKMLEEQLRKQKVDQVKALLDSPDSALVLVSGLIPAGHRKGDAIDLEITLPPGSRATSLRGGYLQDCGLRNYESTKKLNPEVSADKLLPGHILARARGPLLVGLGNPDEPTELRRARIWQGGVALADRPFYMIMKNDEKSARVANAIAERLNAHFRADPQKQQTILQNQRLLLLDDVTQQLNKKVDGHDFARGENAKALNKEMIMVRIPYAYRLNPERYLRVARLLPLREVPEQRSRYRRRLQKMLLDPQDTVRAALRLEALGQDSIPLLKNGLDSGHPLVRFTSAEALTYLGQTAGVEELASLAEPEHHGALRYHCLLAMANLEEAVCRSKLGELMQNPDVELRCGAFLALRLLDQVDPRRRDSGGGGDLLGEAFWLHQVAPKSSPLVHVSLAKRAEIVLFGDDQHLVTTANKDGVRILAGEFTITAAVDDDCCWVSRIRVHAGVRRSRCKLELADVIKTLANLGAQYPDVVEFLRKADERRCLNCPLRINTLPEEVPIETLAENGRDPKFLRDPQLP